MPAYPCHLFLSLMVALTLPAVMPACSSSSEEDPEAPVAGDAGNVAPVTDAGDAGVPATDAGDVGDPATDAGETEEDAGLIVPPELRYTGCDLMEFAPEGRNGQGSESALLNLKVPSLGYFKETTWFTGGDITNGTWMIDAVRLSTNGDPIPFPVGTWKLADENLGRGDDCTVCLDLGRGNMDEGGADDNYYPEEAELFVEAADLMAGGALKVTISGRFRKDADPNGESWCINGLTIDTTLALFCSSDADCPTSLPVCAYPETGSYPVCQVTPSSD